MGNSRKLRPITIVTIIFLALIMATAVGCSKTPVQPESSPSKDKIVIGQAVSLSGPLGQASITTRAVYEIWVKEVNAKGGIYLKEYGKSLPLEYYSYDDKSDVGTMTKLVEKIILEDKADLILPPWGTEMLYAACPIANKHQYVLVGAAGGAAKLKEIMPSLPYVFQVLNFSETQTPALIGILKELGAQTVAVIHHDHLHGVEYATVTVPALKEAGFQVMMAKSFPSGSKDLSPLLKEAKTLGVDAFISFSYPEETMLLTQQAIELGANFKVFFCSVYPYSPDYRDAFGAQVVEGVMGGGAWNEESSPGAKEFVALYKKYFGKEPDDYWGQLYYYASLQHLQQAIEEAGSLDQTKIRDLLATRTYDTCIGPFKYDPDRFFRGHLGQIGQWQKGVFEVVDPGPHRTAPPIMKPPWPKM
ncbi:MAG: amino acid ABC transporter substrate-binding protein [Clostridia bacterium]|jgi:branched-chain amino acid transport system substrate-binding protein|nr:amino acid ABC transporter substrate-binding protein [Clostridia bacterium]